MITRASERAHFVTHSSQVHSFEWNLLLYFACCAAIANCVLLLLNRRNMRFQLSPEPDRAWIESSQKKKWKEKINYGKPFRSFRLQLFKMCTFLLKCFSYLFSLLIFFFIFFCVCSEWTRIQSSCIMRTKCDVRAYAQNTNPNAITINGEKKNNKRWWKEISSSLKRDFYYFTISFSCIFSFISRSSLHSAAAWFEWFLDRFACDLCTRVCLFTNENFARQ